MIFKENNMPINLNHNLEYRLLEKTRWTEVITRFIGVLRINMFIVSADGRMIMSPDKKRYGGRLVVDPALKFDLLRQDKNFMDQFDRVGCYLESFNRYHLVTYALPIGKQNSGEIAGYLVLGPVILNRRLDSTEYSLMAKNYGVDGYDLIDEVNEIRVVSNMMMSSILDLLSEIVETQVELIVREGQLTVDDLINGPYANEIREFSRKVFSVLPPEDVLMSLLSVAVKMTDTECGSVMMLDETGEELEVKVFTGPGQDRLKNRKSKIGEGIVGIAVGDKMPLFIGKDSAQDNRIGHLLKRDEISESVVFPLQSKNRVYGVLNLHTSKSNSRILGSLNNLNYLTDLLSAAF